MNIVILDAQTFGDDIDLSGFKRFGKVIMHNRTTPEQTLDRVSNAEIIITNKVVIGEAVMVASPNLELICVAATGMNNIDLKAAEAHGIAVKNAVGYSTNSVVQHTFTMLFNIIGYPCYYDRYTKSGEWSKSPIFTNLERPFYEIANRRWGVIGLGAIGESVARLAEGFGAEVVYYSTSGKNSNSSFNRVKLGELLKTSDIISIHAPLNDATQNLLSYPSLKNIKSGAVLINVGRGGIVNEDDLAKIIDTQDLWAGLDVLESEPMRKNHPLLKIKRQERIYITPHIAWASIEAREELIKKVQENIQTFLGE